jgi:putative peptidoglycan lipid II flippase
VLIKVLQPSFFAREDTRTPMIYAGVAMAANAALSFVLFVFVGAVGIAVATSVTGWINVALLAVALRRRGEFVLDASFRRTFIGIALASVVMGAVLWALTAWLEPWFAPEEGLLVQVLALTGLIAAGLLTFLGFGVLVGALKPRMLLRELSGH